MTDLGQFQSTEKHTPTPNHERASAMRKKIIDAAIQCLCDLGYHQTTTKAIAERARISRGAILHHFSTRSELVEAVFKEVSNQRTEYHRARLEHISDPMGRFLELIEILWETMISPTGVARLELLLGTRGDPELKEQFDALNAGHVQQSKDNLWLMAKSIGFATEEERKKIDAFTQLYIATMRGLSIDAMRSETRPGAEDAKELLKEMQTVMLKSMLT
ncbi:MAG: TetR/AcrR family transcriptional regulator [Alphaproteobacteria bacterium]|nr:MAG: TetR/AcrR family transcriptional regulator [Alphaproteobacteria bacterium]